MTEAPVLRLNPALDPASFARDYACDGLVRIPDVFEPEVVDRLAGILEQTIDWDVICSTDRGEADILSRERRAELGPDVIAGKLHAATLRARTGFSYVHLGYPMIDAFAEGRDPGHPIHALTAFLNSPELIAFGAAITGEPGVAKIVAQATLYRPADFLTMRDDTGASERLAGYTLGLTREWRPDWGGQLLFHDAAGDVERGFAPAFNVLTLFKAPRRHSVAPVAPYAGAPRLTVTGWLWNDPSDGR
jgi:SM-20-related protein